MKSKHFLIALAALMMIMSGCKKKKDEPVYYYATGQISGIVKTFKTTSSFGKFCIQSGVCNTFYADPEVTGVNSLTIGLPLTVQAGTTYTSDSSNTKIVYIDDSGRGYYSSWGDSLVISVTKWEGHAGTGAGTFYCKLRYSGQTPPYDSVTIKTGSFSSRIWYVVQK